MRILVLVTGETIPAIAKRRGDYPAWIAEKTGGGWRGEWCTHDVRASAPLPGPSDADAFIITGSSSSVTERADWMLRSEDLVRAIALDGIPMLGICFGHQLIAQSLGGEVIRNPKGREVGAMRVTRTADDPLFAGLPPSFLIHGTHVDAVTRLPEGGVRLASTAKDENAAFRFGAAIWGVQFHPEFDVDVMREYIVARSDVLRADAMDPDGLLRQLAGREPTQGEAILRNFAARAELHFSSQRRSPSGAAGNAGADA